jgi:flavin-dependent dehydrogenase
VTYDLIVIGARCAGAALARLTAATGLQVLLLDQSTFPSDTISTHCITLPGIRLLSCWGLLEEVLKTSAPLVKNFNLEIGNEPQRGFFGTGQGAWTLAPRRIALDSVLVQAAARAGATVRDQSRVLEVKIDPEHRMRVIGRDRSDRFFEESAAIVIGADGRHSTLARSVGASIERQVQSRLGGSYAYYSGLSSDAATWAFGEKCSAGMFPTNNGLACVWAMHKTGVTAPEPLDNISRLHSQIRAASESLYQRVALAEQTSQPVVFGPSPGFMRTQVGPGWALIGDANRFSHPITAHGISDAFRDAQLAADAILSHLNGDCTWEDASLLYAMRQDAATSDSFDVTQEIAAADWTMETIADLLVKYKKCGQTVAKMEDEWWGRECVILE